MVLQSLRELHDQGHDLRHARMKQKSQPLFYAARKLFGSYANAVTQAGINYWEMSRAMLKVEREQGRSASDVDAGEAEPAG